MNKILIFLVILTSMGCYNDPYSPVYVVQKINSSKGSGLYLKSKNWGLTFDHQISIITTASKPKDWIPDSTSDLIFKGLVPFVYNFRNDTLTLYVKCKEIPPKNFQSGVTVLQIERENFSELIQNINNGKSKLLKF